MDDKDNDKLNDLSAGKEMRWLKWLSLVLPTLFLILGIGILGGFFFAENNATIQNPVRIPLGIGLLLWGAIRLFLIFRKLQRQKGEGQRG